MKLFFHALCTLLLIAATARAVPVSLRVVDANNKPIANATVSYLDDSDTKKSAPIVTQTAPDGTLALDLKGENRDNSTVDAGQLSQARVRAPGFGFRDVRLLPGENMITLNKSARLQGIVRDETGAPIAGATVTLLGVEQDETYNSDDRLLAQKMGLISVTTQDDGRWQTENLPTGYAYFVAHAPDRAAYYGQLWIHRGENQAQPLALPPAGSIIGRILDRNGKPVAGVSVDMTEYDNPQSDAAGNFRVPNVPLGETALEFASSSAAWLGLDEKIKATVPAPGAVVDVGDVKMGAGLLLSGTIRDQSGAAMPDLELRVDEKTFRTDANGHFEARVAKPFYWLGIAKNYRKIKDTPDVPDDATQFDLGDIVVERTANLPLDVRDENGNAMSQATLKFTSTDDAHLLRKPMFGEGGAEVGSTSSPVQSESVFDGAGVFVPSLPAADYKIEGSGLWGIVAPQTATLTLPETGEKLAPLKIVVRYFAPTRARGRVVDVAGAPIENARVQISAKHSYRSISAFSDENGDWSLLLPGAATEPTLDKIELAPLTFVRGGELKLDGAPENNSWKAADIIMARTNIALTGRVVDDNGGGVAGARVGWNNDAKFESAATDTQGQFEIKGLPNVPTIIFAASSDGARATAATATPGTPLTLKLPPATAPLADAEIEKLWAQLDIKRISDLDRYFETLGNRRVYEVARRVDINANPTQIGEGLSDYFRARASMARTPEERKAVASEGIALLERSNIAAFSGGMAEIAITAARTDDDELRAWAAKWYDAQKPQVKPLDSPDKVEWYDEARTEWVMQVGAALGRDDAEKYRDIWLVQIDKPNNKYIEQFLPEWGEVLWRSDPKWFDEIVGQWPAPQQMRALVGALKVEENAVTATTLLSRLEKLASDPAVVAADAQTSQNRVAVSVESLFEGRTNYARSMALVDAPSALDALDKVQAVIQSGENYQIAATIARAAIANGQSDIARRALKFGLTNRYADGSGALALIARGFDADLAAQLMEVARKNATTNFSPFDPDGWADVASYAVALCEFDASAGRLLLEDQWARRQQPAKFRIPDEEYNKRELIKAQEKLAWAMAFYDVPRALQWLGEIKDDRDKSNNGLERTRLAIVVAALTPPERRSFLLGATYFN